MGINRQQRVGPLRRRPGSIQLRCLSLRAVSFRGWGALLLLPRLRWWGRRAHSLGRYLRERTSRWRTVRKMLLRTPSGRCPGRPPAPLSRFRRDSDGSSVAGIGSRRETLLAAKDRPAPLPGDSTQPELRRPAMCMGVVLHTVAGVLLRIFHFHRRGRLLCNKVPVGLKPQVPQNSNLFVKQLIAWV
jgi:hypothetical protein